MKDKIYDPARHNETAPAEGMAAVNTHTPEEEPIENIAQEETNSKPETPEHENGTSGPGGKAQ